MIGIYLAALLAAPAQADPNGVPVIDLPTQAMIDGGLEWLKRHQDKEGYWPGTHVNGITAFALLAYLSQGHLPGRGPYGETVQRGLEFLLRPKGKPQGLLSDDTQPMYGHGLATLVLAEAWGMTHQDTAVRNKLQDAVRLIVDTQGSGGGWRDEPRPYNGADATDVSVTVMQVMALRAAHDAGVRLGPRELDGAIDKAVAFVKQCHDGATGSFCYQPKGKSSFACTAAGVCVLQFTRRLGDPEPPQIARSLAYLESNPHREKEEDNFWYGRYYAALATYQKGGDVWRRWYQKEREFINQRRTRDGSWPGKKPEPDSGAYGTAIAVIVLSLPANYLPIHQR